MNKVKVEKEKLLAKLRENREEHKKDYLESKENYQKELIKALSKMLKEAKEGKKVDTYIKLEQPTEFLNAYDRAIAMLENGLDDVIDLDQNQFAQYWMDEWHWKDAFFASNSGYSSTVAQKMSRASY